MQVSTSLKLPDILACIFTIFHDLRAHDIFVHSSRHTRSSTLELTLKQLGVEYVTAEELQTAQAESRGAKIAHWIRCLQIAVRLLNFDHKRF